MGFPLAQAAVDGVFATVEEIAAAEKINASYVGRVLRLTLLAPDIVEAILDGRQPADRREGFCWGVGLFLDGVDFFCLGGFGGW